MAIWLQGGKLKITANGSPYDCAHCPCFFPVDCFPCTNPDTGINTKPQEIQVGFGIGANTSGGWNATTNEDCLERCTCPVAPCTWWECGQSEPSNSCCECNRGQGAYPNYPCCTECAAFGGPFTMVSLDADTGQTCQWQTYDIHTCRTGPYQYASGEEYYVWPVREARLSFQKPNFHGIIPVHASPHWVVNLTLDFWSAGSWGYFYWSKLLDGGDNPEYPFYVDNQGCADANYNPSDPACKESWIDCSSIGTLHFGAHKGDDQSWVAGAGYWNFPNCPCDNGNNETWYGSDFTTSAYVTF